MPLPLLVKAAAVGGLAYVATRWLTTPRSRSSVGFPRSDPVGVESAPRPAVLVAGHSDRVPERAASADPAS